MGFRGMGRGNVHRGSGSTHSKENTTMSSGGQRVEFLFSGEHAELQPRATCLLQRDLH
ncbi:unnamed protein product [Heterosigma akashiwo]